jgi:hypothetical protein
MSFVNRISLYEIIGNFVGNTGINNVNDMIDDLARWASEAENHIGSKHSYERHECEIDVENYKACLPRNFAYLNALNIGGEILDKTNREFRMFDKAPKTGLIEEQEQKFNNNQLIVESPGVALVMQMKFCGVFAENEIVTINIQANDCGSLNSNGFNYTVQAGDTIQDILLALVNNVNSIPNLPYSASNNGDTLFITANSPEVIFTITTYTDSIQGTIELTTLVPRVPPKKKESSPKGSDIAIQTTSPNLANRSAAELNTGLTSTNRSGYNSGGYGGYGYPFAGSSSKFTIENGFIYFNQMEKGKVGISYMGIMIDEQGWPMIAEDHADAVSAYLIYMWTKKRFIMGKIGQGNYQLLKQEWEWKCGQARGNDELPDQAEMRYLANQWMQLIPLPNKSLF